MQRIFKKLSLITAAVFLLSGFFVATPAFASVMVVTVSPDTASVQHGNLKTFTATTIDGSGNPVSESYTWSVNNVTGTATIDTSTGILTGGNIGTVTVTATGVTSGASGTSGTINIVQRPITVTALKVTKVYDGDASSAGIPTITIGNLSAGDTALWTESFDNKNAGTGKTLTPAGTVNDGNSGNNYAVTFANNTNGVIAARPITVTAVTNSKIYDGTPSALALPTITAGSLVGGDTAVWSETYNNKNAGTGKTLTPAGTVNDGNGGNNYNVVFATDTTGVITRKNLTVIGITVDNKIYDSTKTATLSGTAALSGIIAPDVVTIGGSPVLNFSNKNVANGKTVTITGYTIGGADSGNYALLQPSGLTADITPFAITGSITAANKTYDGNNFATIATRSLSGVIGSDDVSYTGGVATFDNRNVGTGKTVSASGLILSGNDAGNYTVNATATTTADITALHITVTAVTDTKDYDGTTDSSGTPGISPSLVGGDTSNFIQTFDTPDVGTGKTLTPSGTANDGNGGANYNVTFVPDATGVINAAAITVTADQKSKTYGNPDPVLTYAITSGALIGADTFSGSLTRTLGEDVGTYNINQGTLALSSNYSLTYIGNTFSISPKATLTVTADDKTITYGGPDPSPTFVYSGFKNGDNSSVVDTPPTCSVSGPHSDAGSYAIICSGGSDNNYDFSYTSGTLTVNAKNISITADTQAKIYGQVDPVLTYTHDPLVGSDALSGILTRDAGEDVGIYSINQGTLTAGTNYNVSFTSSTLAISQKPITVTVVPGQTKVYGDDDPASYIYTSDPLIGGDSFTGALARAAGEDVGAYAINQGTLTAGANYTINFVADNFTITARPITVTAVTDSKAYDGNTSSTGTPAITAGSLVGTDSATWTQTFDNKNIGTGKSLIPAGTVSDGNGGNNYAITFINDTTGVITARPITVTAVTDSKTYDGNTSSTGTPTITLGSLIGGDTVIWTQTFDNKNIGTGKSLIPAGTVSDGNGGNNYAVTFVNDTTGVITVRSITVTAATDTKVYDGNTASIGVPTITSGSLAGTDTATWTQTFDTKDVGTGKTLTSAGTVNDGNGGNNYTVTLAAVATGTITKATLTVTGITASDKTYDATTAAALNTGGATLVGVIAPDDVTLDASAATADFADKNVGAGKTVTVSGLALAGADAGNYTLTQPAASANITKATLTVNGITAGDKTYNATTAAALNTGEASLSGIAGEDNVTLNTAGAIGTFSNKNVGAEKTVTVSGLTLGGADAGNYTLTQPTASAGITKRPITVTAVTSSKVYDGNTSSSGAPTITSGSLAGTDTATWTQTFDTKDVGTGKTLTPAGTVSDGNGGNNYAVTFVNDTTGVITASRGGGGGGNNIIYYSINASAGENGSISPSGPLSLVSGSSQTFAIAPNTGYHVANVLVDGNSAGAVTTYTFSNLNSSHTISATFSAGTNGNQNEFKLGDINRDGNVDVLDLSLLMANWGATGANMADINEDGIVDVLDLSIMMANWGL